MRLSSIFFRAARTSATLESLSSPDRAARRAKNITLGRLLGRFLFPWLYR